MLVYTSAVLAQPVDLLGRVFVRLVAASDALDTDFTAKLLDLDPEGRAVLLGPEDAACAGPATGGLRPRSAAHAGGGPRPNRIELFDIGHRFPSGHRIRLEISSSGSPFVDPNPNTGLPIATDTTWRVARQTSTRSGPTRPP